MKLILTLTILFLANLHTGTSCRCFQPFLIKDYYKPDIVSFVRAKVVVAVNPTDAECRGSGKRRFYVLQILQEYKACRKQRFVLVESSCSSASCGVYMQLHKEYVVPLRAEPIPFINSCQVCFATSFKPCPHIHAYAFLTALLAFRTLFSHKQFIRLYSSLTKAEITFLNTREVCCVRGVCKCADGSRPVACKRPPCEYIRPPCPEATSCNDNFCGGCGAEWFDADGAPVCLPL